MHIYDECMGPYMCVHNTSVIECEGLKYRFSNIQRLETHLQKDHEIALKSQTLQFETFAKFLEWKEKEQRDTFLVCATMCTTVLT